MRTGILSDESVMKMCAEFQPVPLGAVNSILSVKQPEPQLVPRKLKYTQPPARPAFFGAMSNSMAKQMDPTNTAAIRANLNEQYVEELQEANVNLINYSPDWEKQDEITEPEASDPGTPVRVFDASPRLQSFVASKGSSSKSAPGRLRETADVRNLREALQDSEIAARAMHSPGFINLRSRSYPNTVRGTIGSGNLFNKIMGEASSSYEPYELDSDSPVEA